MCGYKILKGAKYLFCNTSTCIETRRQLKTHLVATAEAREKPPIHSGFSGVCSSLRDMSIVPTGVRWWWAIESASCQFLNWEIKRSKSSISHEINKRRVLTFCLDFRSLGGRFFYIFFHARKIVTTAARSPTSSWLFPPYTFLFLASFISISLHIKIPFSFIFI